MINRLDYSSPADLFPSRRYAKSSQARYRRFQSVAEAVQYVIEQMPQSWLNGTYIDIDGTQYEGRAIKALYDAPDYPLDRTKTAA